MARHSSGRVELITEADRERFLEQGYLVIPDVVPKALREAVIGAITAFTGLQRDDPETWYRDRREGHGIVPLHHHQALWDVRQHPPVYEIFKTLYGDANLWVTMDRVSYKPPASEATRDWQQADVHWDCDPWQDQGPGIQGLVYLTDTDEAQGPFSCVPSIYRNLGDWLRDHADDEDRRRPVVSDGDLVPVAASAGSLVVWHRLMPHTSLLNRSGNHRFVQYVAMVPEGTESQRQQQVRDYREKMPPAWAIRQRVPGQEIPETGEPAQLTELGRKLVGLERW